MLGEPKSFYKLPHTVSRTFKIKEDLNSKALNIMLAKSMWNRWFSSLSLGSWKNSAQVSHETNMFLKKVVIFCKLPAKFMMFSGSSPI